MILLTPGPTPIPPQVLEAMARPVIHHRTPEFEAIQRECAEALQRVFRTTGPVLMLGGSGTLAFESAQVSLVRPGDTVVTCASGRFGERWQEAYDRMAPRFGLTNVKVSAPWGEAVRPEALREALRRHPKAAIVTVVHSESSTASANDVRALASIVRDIAPGALVLVDGVSSVGALPLEMDDWGIDAAASASQKALMMAPGLAFVALSRRAVERMMTTPAADVAAPLYMDLRGYLDAQRTNSALFTPPVNLVVGLRASLAMLLERGVERAWAGTSALARTSRDSLMRMGFRLMSQAPADSLTGAFYLDGVGDELRRACKARRGVHLADGQDQWKGRGFRMSHMGYVSPAETVAALEAIGAELTSALPRAGADSAAGVEIARERLIGAARAAS